MQNIPKDPFILLSFLNLKLRDEFLNLDELILSYNLDKTELIQKMDQINYIYDHKENQFKGKI